MSLLLILLIVIGPFLVAAPGALAAAIQCPDEFFGRRPQAGPVVRSRWAVA